MTVQEEVRQRIERDALLAKLRGKIGSGKATYADTATYSNRAGKLLGEIFSRRLPEIPLSDREALCAELLHDRYTDINALCDRVQEALDEAQGLHLRPQHALFDTKRAHQIGGSTVDPSKPEDVRQRRARAATETMTKSMHDDRIKAEAKFRHRAGLDCRITRVAVNGCCEWCSKVAGRYVYGEEPEKIYQRHDNCDCTVTFENGRKRQDVWSKREWEAPEPGAGAGDPVVFTAEQAKALQKEKQLSYLTGGVKHGKLNAEEKIFLDRILADPEMEPKYRQILMDRFCSGSEIAQKAFNRFVPAESVANKSYSGIAHYVHNGNRIIWMNYSRDLKPGSSWLPGSTWFHEHGHLIDDYANRGTGLLSSHHPQFYDALKSDFVKLIQAQSQGAAIKNYEDALEYILNNTKLQLSFSSDLMKSKAQQESVSDIIEGLSDSYIRGCGGHNSSGIRPNSPKDDYWGEGKEREIIISAEAAAHMFEAQFDVGRYNQMKMYFPNALRIYEDMLKEVVS